MKARELARLVHVSEAGMIQHLRELVSIHFVESLDPETTPFRYRAWSAVPGGVRLGDYAGTEDYTRQADDWLKVAILTQAKVLQDWVSVSDSWPSSWRTAVEQWDHVMLSLDQTQLRQLSLELHNVVERWRKVSISQEVSKPSEGRPVYVVTHAIPYPMPYKDSD